jgi:hypothetical protein
MYSIMPLLLLFLLFSCNLYNPSVAGRGSLKIEIDNVQAKTILPSDVSIDIVSYEISGIGPNNAVMLPVQKTETSFTLSNLLAGSWTITIAGENASGIKVASASKEVTVVAHTTTTVIIQLVPITGSGTLALTVSWPSDKTLTKVSGTLTPDGGDDADIDLTVSGNSATYTNSSLATGSYVLVLDVFNDGIQLCPTIIEAVRIYKNMTSTGNLTLSASDFFSNTGFVSVTVTNPPNVKITLSGNKTTLAYGTSMTVTATPSATVDSYLWYLDGKKLSDTTGSVSIGSDLLEGEHRLTIITKKSGSLSSASALFNVVKEISGSWTDTTSVPTATAYGGGGIYNSRIYSLGGLSSPSGVSKNSYVALINSEGEVGTWQETTSPLGTSVYYFGSTIYNGFIYKLGGASSGVVYDTAQFAPINSDGTIGIWQATTSLPTTLFTFGCVAFNGFIYVIGGERFYGDNDHSDASKKCLYAPLNLDGSIGSWQETSNLPDVRIDIEESCSVGDGYIYVCGGSATPSATVTDSVVYAKINSDGTLGTWASGASLPSARRHGGASYSNGYLYYIGGGIGNTPYSAVVFSRIGSDGMPGEWKTGPSLNHASSACVSYSDSKNLYVIGGWDGTNVMTRVEYIAVP